MQGRNYDLFSGGVFGGRDSEARRAEGRGPKPPPHQLEGLGERCKLPQWGPGRSPGRKRFWRISKPVEDIFWKQFLSQEQCWQL